ncbi:hypothetical protein NXS98_07765 [Fontisphaera persica]|uniref:TlpA family protein disulfide reductase n=1 Tax=Fontisphaera persica TaxID=2974023 RepID=UPI0024BFE326|nr:hypothetical protein [Fontisphaera persica]WCJ61004.1 hypothetical protein NXS98_07765 [Fontisphaera persica]
MTLRCVGGGWLAAVCLLAAHIACGQTSTPPVERITAFVLQDQYGTNHTLSLPLRRLTLFTVADKQGADEVAGWVSPVYLLYSNRLDIVGIANVSAAPRWWQGQVRRDIRRTYAHPVLLDWTGAVTASFGAAHTALAVFVARPDGAIIYRQTGPATAAALERLLQLLAAELKQQP